MWCSSNGRAHFWAVGERLLCGRIAQFFVIAATADGERVNIRQGEMRGGRGGCCCKREADPEPSGGEWGEMINYSRPAWNPKLSDEVQGTVGDRNPGGYPAGTPLTPASFGLALSKLSLCSLCRPGERSVLQLRGARTTVWKRVMDILKGKQGGLGASAS